MKTSKCTHNCETCPYRIVGTGGNFICTYLSSRDINGNRISLIDAFSNILSNSAIDELFKRDNNFLYIYPDGLYIYSPKMCIKQKENYKLVKDKIKKDFRYERMDEQWVIKNSKKGLKL